VETIDRVRLQKVSTAEKERISGRDIRKRFNVEAITGIEKHGQRGKIILFWYWETE
jgi:hypothetical protein